MSFATETMLMYATYQQEQRIREAEAWRRAHAVRAGRRSWRRANRVRQGGSATPRRAGRTVRWLRSLTEWPRPV